jgi:hypothetical protein
MKMLMKKCGLVGNDVPHEANNGLNHDFNEDNISVSLSGIHCKNRRQNYLSAFLDVVGEAGNGHSDFERQFLQNFEKCL